MGGAGSSGDDNDFSFLVVSAALGDEADGSATLGDDADGSATLGDDADGSATLGDDADGFGGARRRCRLIRRRWVTI